MGELARREAFASQLVETVRQYASRVTSRQVSALGMTFAPSAKPCHRWLV